MLKAISDLGFQPSRHGSIKVSGKSKSFQGSVSQDGKLSVGKKGQLALELTSDSGGKAEVSVMNEALGVKASGTLGFGDTVKLDIELPDDAKAGDHNLTVVIRVGDEELRLQVPIQVE